MTKAISINVYIVTYNRAIYLKETIQSVLNQTYQDFILYILDNASNDNTSDVVLAFKDKRLHYIRHEQNIGGYGNIRYAMDHCQADYYVIFHDDDIMLPDFLQSEVEVLQKDDTVDIVAGSAILFGNTSGLIKKPKKKSAYHFYGDMELFRSFMRQGNFLVFPSIMYRKSFMNNYQIRGKRQAGPAGDVVLYFDIERCGGRVCEISRPIMKYRIHDNQDSAQKIYSMNVNLYHFLRM